MFFWSISSSVVLMWWRKLTLYRKELFPIRTKRTTTIKRQITVTTQECRKWTLISRFLFLTAIRRSISICYSVILILCSKRKIIFKPETKLRSNAIDFRLKIFLLRRHWLDWSRLFIEQWEQKQLKDSLCKSAVFTVRLPIRHVTSPNSSDLVMLERDLINQVRLVSDEFRVFLVSQIAHYFRIRWFFK